jgi:hypothetical protein
MGYNQPGHSKVASNRQTCDKKIMSRFSFWVILAFGWLWTADLAAKSPSPAATVKPWLQTVQHAPRQPRSGDIVKVSVEMDAQLKDVTLVYQVVEPGSYVELKDASYRDNWVSVPMQSQGATNDASVYQAELPGSVQKNRRLIRYRIAATDPAGRRLISPDATAPCPNYGYFVYDGIPAWTAAINPQSPDPRYSAMLTFPPEAMRRVQPYFLLAKKTSVENATWKQRYHGRDYPYHGTLVVDGEVFDHIGFRARGGVWRYELGKNMWKFDINSEPGLRARDDFGRAYPVAWNKVNLRSCIQQGDYGERGEQGLFESVGFRLFNLAGVAAPHTHWVQLRIVSEAKETPEDQYHGDFWGLYLAIENDDGKFLKTHGLPNGNLYKMENGTGELKHHGANAVTNRSDLNAFMATYYRSNQSDDWWKTNLDLPGYYSYRAICECIHHYDVDSGKNYDYYFNPKTQLWQVFPWDIDLTWADHMFGNGEDPFKRRVLSRPAFRLEYLNRLREIRDLLFNPEQTGQLIDEYAAVIWESSGAPSLVEADRRKWDFHPMMSMSSKSGQGLFYQASPTRDFAGMQQVMKRYVKTRGAWIDNALLTDRQIPATPTLSFSGPTNGATSRLRLRASAYQGANPFAAIKFRLADITPPGKTNANSRTPRCHEITPVWESAELNQIPIEQSLPDGVTRAGGTYRARVRMKDATGRWSHWSAPLEFVDQANR